MLMDWPEIQWAWLEQRKTMVLATSVPVPGRPMGMFDSRRSQSSRPVGVLSRLLSRRDVSITPGQTQLIARIFGPEYNGTWGHFAPVKVNDVLTLDFDDSDDPRSNHYAFLASDEEFDAVLQRVKDEGMSFGSGPGSRTDGESNHAGRGRGFYFERENGYVWDVVAYTCVAD